MGRPCPAGHARSKCTNVRTLEVIMGSKTCYEKEMKKENRKRRWKCTVITAKWVCKTDKN